MSTLFSYVPLVARAQTDIYCSPIYPTAIPIEAVEKNPLIALVITAYGGHIGFVEGLTIHETNFFDRLFIQFVKPFFALALEGRLKDLIGDADNTLEEVQQ